MIIRWISTKDKLPQKDVVVLLFTVKGEMDVGFLNERGCWEKRMEWEAGIGYVTHWRALPKQPRK